MSGFDWKKFASATVKKRAATKGKKKSGSGNGQKSNAWRAYVTGGKKR